MTAGFTAAERRELARAMAEGRTPRCPHCDAVLSQAPVAPPRQVSYVRHRVWLLCPGCRRTGAVDVPADRIRGDGPR